MRAGAGEPAHLPTNGSALKARRQFRWWGPLVRTRPESGATQS